jgi:hypothetical protein
MIGEGLLFQSYRMSLYLNIFYVCLRSVARFNSEAYNHIHMYVNLGSGLVQLGGLLLDSKKLGLVGIRINVIQWRTQCPS